MDKFSKHREERIDAICEGKFVKGQTVRLKKKYAENDKEAKMDYVVRDLRGPRILIAPKKWPKGQIAPTEVVGVEMVENYCEECNLYEDLVVEAAEHEGKKVKLNDPIRTSEVSGKKFKVYVKNDKGSVVVVRFGDPNMEIKRDDPKRRASFRARHGCDNPGPKWKAKYWSCYQWRAGANVDS